MSHPKIIVCNWKMNGSIAFLDDYAKSIADVNLDDFNVIIAPPALYLANVRDIMRRDISICAQEVHYEDSGPHTGSISVSMVKECGVSHVIIGHSECRKRYINRTDEEVSKTVELVVDKGLIPIICVGDSFEERSSAMTLDVVSYQIEAALQSIRGRSRSNIIIAYEPIWAIGTGVSADPHDILIVRDAISHLLSKLEFSNAKILYGGSVDKKNAKDFLNTANTDGLIIGTASLDPTKIIDIMNILK